MPLASAVPWDSWTITYGGKQLYLICFSVGILLLVVSLLAVSIGYVYQEMVKSSQMRYYQKMANTDLMTQLDSRTAFEERVRRFPDFGRPLRLYCCGHQQSEAGQRYHGAFGRR